MESVVLGLDAGVLHHAAGIGLQTRHGAPNVSVDFDDFFDGRGFEEGGGDALFDAEDDTFAGCDLWGFVNLLIRWIVSVVDEGGGGLTPIAVEPSFIASREYSTWKRRPSGEKVLGELSVCLLINEAVRLYGLDSTI